MESAHSLLSFQLFQTICSEIGEDDMAVDSPLDFDLKIPQRNKLNQ
jgi:hypothetical protein